MSTTAGGEEPAITASATVGQTDRDPSGRAVRSGYALSLGAMVMLQGGNALAVTLVHEVSVTGAVALRTLFGSVVILVVVRPPLRRLPRSEVGLVLLFGLVLAGMNLTFYEALQRLSLGIAVTIALLGPLTVAASSSRRKLDLIWPAVAIVGVLLIVLASDGTGPPTTALGLLFGALTAACWGIYILVAAAAGERFGGVQGLALASGVAAVLCLPLGLLTGGRQLLRGPVLVRGLGAGAAGTALPYMLETQALRRLSTRSFGVLASMEPAVASVEGLIFLGQRPGKLAIAGILLVILASSGASMPAHRPPMPAA